MHFRTWDTGGFGRARQHVQRVLRDESGATMAEYGVMIMAIIAFGGVVMGVYGAQLNGFFQSLGTSMQSFSSDVTKDMK